MLIAVGWYITVRCEKAKGGGDKKEEEEGGKEKEKRGKLQEIDCDHIHVP